MDIRPASAADLTNIVTLHRKTFKGLFSGDLSVSTLTAYYQTLLRNRSCRTFVASIDNQFAGFISGCASGDYLPSVLKVRLIAEALLHFRALDLLRIFKKALDYRRLGISSELISVSVMPQYQRKQVGSVLVDTLETFFKDQGVREYFVFTDLLRSRGIEFYRARDFTEVKRVSIYGLDGVFLKKVMAP